MNMNVLIAADVYFLSENMTFKNITVILQRMYSANALDHLAMMIFRTIKTIEQKIYTSKSTLCDVHS